jgi:hypothetical protein
LKELVRAHKQELIDVRRAQAIVNGEQFGDNESNGPELRVKREPAASRVGSDAKCPKMTQK